MIDLVLLTLLLCLTITIGYFNIEALFNYNKKFNLKKITTKNKCKYSNLPVGTKAENGSYSIVENKSSIKFSLDVNPVVYTQVCSSYCKLNQQGTHCLDPNNISENHLQECLDLLKPNDTCIDISKPLAKDDKGNYLYPQKVIF